MPKAGSNIYKRKDGRWEARYIKSITPDGKKKYASVYANTYREVKEKQAQGIQNVHLLINTTINMTVEELMWAWLSSRKNTIKKTTYLKYESIIKNHFIDGLGKVPFRYLTGPMVDTFANEKVNRNPGRLSPKTVNDILTVLGLALSFGEREYGVSKIRIPRIKERYREMRVLSVTEQTELERLLLTDMDLYKLGVFVALYTGIRLGELCALRWEDFNDNTLTISKSLHRIRSGNNTILEITSPKSRSSIRKIPVPAFLLHYIEQYRAVGPVLKTAQGNLVEPRLMQNRFKKYTLACGLENVSFHTLRHTFATRCVEAGFDIKSLSEILGHADVKTTLNRYVHSSFDLKRCNMEKLQMASKFIV